MNIAIIGGGVSGLVAAYRLGAEHAVTLFEANEHVGGHVNTIDVACDGERHAIDTGFVVFNDWTYPNFVALLDELGVASKPTTMSFSVRDDSTGMEYNGHSLDTLFAQRRNLLRPAFHRMLLDIQRFNRHARRYLEDDCDEVTVGEFLSRHGYSEAFAKYYLLPMGSAIWSCPTGAFAQFPIRFIIEFYENHGLLNIFRRPTWRVVDGGAATYVRALTRRFHGQIRTRTPIESVRRLENHVEVRPRGAPAETFDHVVFACHADQARRVLGGDATAVEREIVAAFPYQQNTAVLHTDTSLLPKTPRAWASWNYRLRGDDPGSPASVTYNMNILQRIPARSTFCVTLNGDAHIAPERVLGRFAYEHPIFTTSRAAAQARHRELLDCNRTSFCGAYWRNGFHEDGVVSALAVVNALRARNAPRRDAHAIHSGVA